MKSQLDYGDNDYGDNDYGDLFWEYEMPDKTLNNFCAVTFNFLMCENYLDFSELIRIKNNYNVYYAHVKQV